MAARLLVQTVLEPYSEELMWQPSKEPSTTGRIEYLFPLEGEWFGRGASLRLVMTDEGVIFDHVDAQGNVLASCAGTAEEITTDWCHE